MLEVHYYWPAAFHYFLYYSDRFEGCAKKLE